MAHPLPPLPKLRLFEAAGRHGSFTAAAAELHVTPSAISHAVRGLEDQLGLPLFHRDRNALRLTAAGQDLAEEASRAFAGLARCMDRLGRVRDGGLALSVAPTFAASWLLARLPGLHRRHPGLAISLTTERDWVTLGDGRHDMAIRMAAAPRGPGEWLHLVQERLLPVTARPMPLEAALARLPAIHVTSVAEDWAAWAARRGLAPPDPARGLRVDTVHMAMEAAAKGLGVALARLPVTQDDLAGGRLHGLDPPQESRTGYWLVTRPGLLRQREARQLAAWLRAELAAG
ncbi:LysR substrate-binding domain-containing protein [Falsiroseomonas selenitidurans]|uniref:LysR family transcriptional regulator n=1 Tax=Falsiroseomonas selenitidurans TaxID=2716335 RepID=A0ABX1EBJ9_9PROT|nr:LysR substrate-binding domain-containing protein [Falsiroseomonas selenitidurans]NKC32857.1 LysR family transcriptional regulator [Falsiroseomonas selenitidurans]